MLIAQCARTPTNKLAFELHAHYGGVEDIDGCPIHAHNLRMSGLHRSHELVPQISLLQMYAFAKAIRSHPSLSQRHSVHSPSISNASADALTGPR
jgi:hypothetical protein